MIEIKDLEFGYSRRKSPVLKDFSLTFEPGRIYGLLGKNGTGKSTLLYLICGLLRPKSGSILIDGAPSTDRDPRMLEEIFLVPEEFELPNIKLSQYVSINAPFYPNFNYEILNNCLKEFKLPLSLNLGRLSMGQKKKVYMSFALATGTRYLIMDEPTNGMDIPAKSQFRKIVSTYMSDERTLIISTHQVRDIDMLIDQVTILNESKLLMNLTTAEICSALRFEERKHGESLEDALFYQPSVQGYSVICPNTTGEDTTINIELLFNAALAQPEVISNAKIKK